MNEHFSIGLDFGTESCRAILVNVSNGEVISQVAENYPHGVINENLPDTEIELPLNWALQDPGDWLFVAEKTISTLVRSAEIEPDCILGLGIDFTSCTLLPVFEDGTPLCWVNAYKKEPHAWPKLWKHHSPQGQADRLTHEAIIANQRWLDRYGGKVSSEWLLPKVLEIIEEKPEIYHQSKYFIEAVDWVTWQLTGNMVRNSCCAGYKGTWHKQDGFPDKEFLKSIHSDLSNVFEQKIQGQIIGPGKKAGLLTKKWAGKFGLTQNCAVSVGIIDAHSAAIGSGLSGFGSMFLMMGTSTCHMLMHTEEILIEGISGVVEDGIVPGLYGYESGQASVGDIFAWFVGNCVPSDYIKEAENKICSIHSVLSEKASLLKPGESGLLSIDWWNGCRTPLVDAALTGMVLGLNLKTKPEEIYRALIEATAFGTKLIIDLFTQAGVTISKLQVGGGLTKNPLILRIYSDITQLPIHVASAKHASALGAAILGSVAAGYYDSIAAAVDAMVMPSSSVIQPVLKNHLTYSMIFKEYKKLISLFGRDEKSSMKQLLSIRASVLKNY